MTSVGRFGTEPCFGYIPGEGMSRVHLDYNTFGELSTSVAKRLNDIGVEKGDRVALILDNSVQWAALSYGANYIAVDGTYDDANRIAAQIGDSKGIGVVNINMRSHYVEGSKTFSYEVAEQLDWTVPDQLIVPVGSGAMLNAICKGFEELQTVSLLDDVSNMHMIAAQPHGCAPIVDAFKKNTKEVIPVENPDTVAKSLAIGDPGDGRYVLKRLEQYNGFAEECDNQEILDAILLLAQTEGIFTEPAGGVSISILQKMVEQGKIDKNDKVVCYVTGNGLKATESIMQVLTKPTVYKPNINEISAVVT